jgi:hypothetical protein
MFSRRFWTKVVSVQKRSRTTRPIKVDDKWEMQHEEIGWFMQMEGSHEMLFIGKEEPQGVSVGDVIEVTIRCLPRGE